MANSLFNGICLPPETVGILKKKTQSLQRVVSFTKQETENAITSILDGLGLEGEQRNFAYGELQVSLLEEKKKRLKKQIKQESDRSGRPKKEDQYLFEKIDSISDLYEDVDPIIQQGVRKRLGMDLTTKEIETLVNASKAVSEHIDEFGNPIRVQDPNNPNLQRLTDEFGEAYKAYRDTVANINPSPLSLRIGQYLNTTLLADFSPVVTNIVANISSEFADVLSKDPRATVKIADKASEIVEQAYQDALFSAKYGYDVTRAQNFDDSVKVLGEVVSNLPSITNLDKYLKGFNELIYDKALGAPDQMIASIAKRETIYREVSNILEKQGILKDNPEYSNKFYYLVNDSLSLNPTTPEGKILKDYGIKEANLVTFQKRGILSDATGKIRNNLDELSTSIVRGLGVPEKAVEFFRLGHGLTPFITSATNAIEEGIKYSGLATVGKSSVSTAKLFAELLNPETKEFAVTNWVNAIKNAHANKALTGVGAGLLLASTIPAENYTGAYPRTEEEKRLFALGQYRENSVNIYGTQVSLDYLGPIAAPFIGIMEMKKQNMDNAGTIGLGLAYLKGAVRQVLTLPAFELMKDVNDLVKSAQEKFNISGEQGEDFNTQLQKVFDDAFYTKLQQTSSRLAPSITWSAVELFDYLSGNTAEKDRRSAEGIEKLAPRQQLEDKINTLGQSEQGSGLYEFFFGSRVKKKSDDPVIQELDTMKNEGAVFAPTDYIKKSASKTYNIPKDKILDEKREYGQGLYKLLKKEIDSSKWQNLSPDEKKETFVDIQNSYRTQYKKILKERYKKTNEEE